MKKIYLIPVLFMFATSMILAQETNKSANEDMFSYIPYKSATWNEKITIESDAGVNTIQRSVWFKDKKMRTEGTYLDKGTGKEGDQIIIVTAKYMYVIFPEKKQGIQYSMDSANNPEKEKQSANKARESAKKTGSEKINGVDCDIYKYSTNTKNGKNKIYAEITEWRDKTGGFPLKTEKWMKITGEQTGTMKAITEISDLKINASVPDSKFVPDSDVQIGDMDEMMKANTNQQGQGK